MSPSRSFVAIVAAASLALAAACSSGSSDSTASTGGAQVGDSSFTVDVGSDFDKISVSNRLEVLINVGPVAKVTASGPGLSPGDLDASISDATLTLSATSDPSVINDPKVRVDLPTLRGVSFDSGSSGKIENGSMTGDTIEIRLEEGVSFDGSVKGGDIDAKASAGSKLTLSGLANKATFQADSGSSFEMAGLTVADATFNLAEASTATIDVTSTLSVQLSQGSKVTYSGGASVTDENLTEGSELTKS